MQAGDQAPAPGIDARRILTALAWGMLLVAVVYFAWRGVWRAANDSGDLAIGYSAARVWLIGHDPYDVAALKRELSAAGGADVAGSNLLDRLLNVYFPTTLPTFVPLATVQWPVARLLALALNVASSVFIALALVRLLGWRRTSPRALALIAFLLALAPIHTTISLGQTAVVATAGIVGGMLLERSGRRRSAGLMYGLATAIKVQLGLPFVAYVLWRRRWLTGATAGFVIGILTLISVIRMTVSSVPWFDSWWRNLASLSGPGGLNDPGMENPERFSLINLQYPLSTILPSRALAELVTFVAVGVAALVLVRLVRGRDVRQELLAMSTVAVLCLLVTYHRYYDAVLLALPIAWAFSAIVDRRRLVGAVVLALCADFVVPFQTALHDPQLRQVVPAWLVESALWNVVIVAQHAWALVLLVLVLLWAAARERNQDSATDSPRP